MPALLNHIDLPLVALKGTYETDAASHEDVQTKTVGRHRLLRHSRLEG